MSDEDDDPFADMPDDRDGDPFERLAGPGESSDDTDAGDDTDGEGFEEEFIEADEFIDVHDDAPELEPEGGTESADADLFDEMDAPDGEADPFDEMGTRDGDPFAGGEGVFESVDIDALDEDELWDAIEGEGDASTPTQKRYSEVSKHRFCEQCEFFAEPPAAHCTHEDARILEYLDMETVRLVNCPVVAEQRRIENEE